MTSPTLRNVLRCPVCFARQIDVNLRHEGTQYSCVRCSYTGTAADIAAMYTDLRTTYRWLTRRVTRDELRTL